MSFLNDSDLSIKGLAVKELQTKRERLKFRTDK